MLLRSDVAGGERRLSHVAVQSADKKNTESFLTSKKIDVELVTKVTKHEYAVLWLCVAQFLKC